MPRDEFVEDDSRRFWEIELEGARFCEFKAALPNAVLVEPRENSGDDEDRYVAVGE